MPSKTFLNLSEQKRNRIIQAAIKELSSAPFAETSINKIVKEAGISRGSFYMYFEDKYDLTLYLLEITKAYLFGEAKNNNISVSGDLDEFIVGLHNLLYDYYIQAEYRNFFKNILIYFQGKPESEIKCMKSNLPLYNEVDNIYEIIDKNQFKSQDKEFIVHSIELTIIILRNVMLQSFLLGLDKTESTKLLKDQLNILKQGYWRNN